MEEEETEVFDETDSEPAPEPPRKRANAPTISYNVYSAIGAVVAIGAAITYYWVFVRVPPRPPLPPPLEARFTGLLGDVNVKSMAKAQWLKADEKMVLKTGDLVRTDPASGAEITFSNANVVRVRPDSIVLIGQPAEGDNKASWRLQAGQVNFEVQQATEIVTPSVRTTTTANASGNIDVGVGGDTGIKIFQGSAQVSTRQGETITLNPNEALKVDALGKAGQKVILPGVPVLTGPTRQAELPFVPAPGTTTQLTWNSVPNGTTYRVAMDFNVVKANLLLAATLDEAGIAATAHELKGLDAGKYFWRVAAVSKDGLEGGFSKVASFSVVRPAAPTPEPSAPTESLVVENVDLLSNVLQVRGKALAGYSVTVDGHPIKVRADGSFNEYLQKPEGGEVVIRALGPNGEVAEQKRPVVVVR
jgi:hypothetical protein